MHRAGPLAYREALPEGPETGDPVLCLHGFPESSYMWRQLFAAITASGRRAIAPDLPGFGDSPALPANTWEAAIAAIEELVSELRLGPVVLVVHDWGGLIGLRWACDEPGRVSALVISDTGFFADGRWHGMAEALRTPGTGEQVLESITREAFGQVVRSSSRGMTDEAIEEYWRAASTAEGRRAVLELYRSGDFSKLAPYEGRLGELGVPTLLLWGADDEFAPVAGAKRFAAEIPDASLAVIEEAGHFVYADAPQRCGETIGGFLESLPERGG